MRSKRNVSKDPLLMSMSHTDFKAAQNSSLHAGRVPQKALESKEADQLNKLFKQRIEKRNWDINATDRKITDQDRLIRKSVELHLKAEKDKNEKSMNDLSYKNNMIN